MIRIYGLGAGLKTILQGEHCRNQLFPLDYKGSYWMLSPDQTGSPEKIVDLKLKVVRVDP